MMSKVDYEIGADAILSKPLLQGAEYVELSQFDFKLKIFVMRLQSEDGEWDLTFKGVAHLNITDLQHQNLISRIAIRKGEKISDDFKKLISKFNSGKAAIDKYTAIEMTSSVGAIVNIICEKFEIHKV
jgi:hypothetical protein